MPKTPSTPFAAHHTPGKKGGYAEPRPERKRGEDAEDAFEPEFEQGRETTRERDQDADPDRPSK